MPRAQLGKLEADMLWAFACRGCGEEITAEEDSLSVCILPLNDGSKRMHSADH